MKCLSPSPYGDFLCELEYGHEGPHNDGMHDWIGKINLLGRDMLLSINAELGLNLIINEETTKHMEQIFINIAEEHEFNYCPDCDSYDE